MSEQLFIRTQITKELSVTAVALEPMVIKQIIKTNLNIEYS